MKKNGVFFLAKSYLGLEILLFVILIVHVICIYLPHINYTITITKRYKNVESNGEEA